MALNFCLVILTHLYFRERMRVEAFNSAFGTLRQLLPTLPPDKKLSKIEILRLAICYIKYLDNVLKPDFSECLKQDFSECSVDDLTDYK